MTVFDRMKEQRWRNLTHQMIPLVGEKIKAYLTWPGPSHTTGSGTLVGFTRTDIYVRYTINGTTSLSNWPMKYVTRVDAFPGCPI